MSIKPGQGDALPGNVAETADAHDGGAFQEPIDRRRALKRLGLAAGAAWVTPTILDSFTSPVGAAAAASALLCDTPSGGMVTVPAERDLFFDVGGGGGGGGSRGSDSNGMNGGTGGIGAQVTGHISGQAMSYELTVHVGMAGVWTNPWDWNGDGGTGYRNGGAGGDNQNGTTGTGGGGGGASAIESSSPSILVVASGGGGGGGGGTMNGAAGGAGGNGDNNGSPATGGSNNNAQGASAGRTAVVVVPWEVLACTPATGRLSPAEQAATTAPRPASVRICTGTVVVAAEEAAEPSVVVAVVVAVDPTT